MKPVLAGLLSLMLATAASAANGSEVHWKDIVGVITAQGVDNPVSDNIHSGTFAWSTRKGHAEVDLETGQTTFEVKGLVINGTMFSGTAGPISFVTGTLVCNAGDAVTEAASDTAVVPLSPQGAAHFTGVIDIPNPCTNPLFLIRIANLAPGANGKWIATGVERTGGN